MSNKSTENLFVSQNWSLQAVVFPGLYNTTAFICEESMADVRCYRLCLPCQFS